MADIFKLKNIELDTFLDKNNRPVTYFSQGDRLSDKLYIDLSNRDEEIDITTAEQVRIDFLKPDGKRAFQYCLKENATKGIVSVVLNSQTVAAVGEVYAEVTVMYPNGVRVVTRKFSFQVNEAIASDASVASMDFAPMLDKAIEAGDKLQGVDIDAIINAGQLAAGALPKTGGTMTGSVRLDKSPASGTGWRSISWDLDAAEAIRMGLNGSNYFVMWDPVNNVIPVEYRPNTKEVRLGSSGTVNILGDTNVYKKTELYSGWVTPTGNAAQLPTGTDIDTVTTSGIYGGTGFVNSPDGGTDLAYIEVWTYGNYALQRFVSMSGSNRRSFIRRKSGSSWGGWQREINEDGGVMTGDIEIKKNTPGLSFTVPDGSKSCKILYNAGNTSDYGFQLMSPTGKAYLRTTGESAAREIATKEKDGRVTLTPTADGENPTTNTPPTAIRRGNTVNVTGSLRRKAGSTGTTVVTLSTDYVPIVTQKFHALATDGTNVLVTINSGTGNIDFSVAGKEVFLQCTYVVD